MRVVASETDEAGQVVATWSELGLPGLVDVHTHFLPEPVMAKVWAYFDAGGPLVARDWPITYRRTEQERLATLRAFGVRAFTALVYPHRPGMAAWLNEWAAEFAARVPECVPGATFFPEPGAARYLTEALDAGARVVKAHLQVGGYDPRDPLLDEVWGLLAGTGVPVIAHCASGPVPAAFTGPGPIGEVLARHPRLRLVVAHLGMPEYAEFLDLAERYPEVWLDTTMAFTDFVEQVAPFPEGLRHRLVELGGRIVLGSGFPNIPYPYLHQLRSLEGLGLGRQWLRSVLWDNGARLLGLDPAARALR